jgi:outer membrane protein OmpA-like peptidoglycan-associated protein
MSLIPARLPLLRIWLPVFAGLALAGCIAVPPPQHYTLSSDVLFDFGRANLRPQATDALRSTLGQMRATYPNAYIQVEGHTDSIGSDAANDALSLRRAEVVRTWLVSAGVPPTMVQTRGMGRRQPVAPNTGPDGRDDPSGRARNRRVELIASPG